THAWIWWVTGSPKLSARARRAIERDEERGVCAISCWEIAMLVRKGRLTLDRDAGDWIRAALRQPGVVPLELTPATAARAGLCAGEEGDPADRLIAATALEHGAPLVTRDERLRDWKGLPTIW